MAKKDRKERRKHLQPELGTEKKDKQLISELKLVEETENAVSDQPKTGFAAWKENYAAYREKRQSHTVRKQVKVRALSIFGAVTLVFALIGVIATVQYSASLWQAITTRQALKEELTPVIAPYVVTDAPEFTDASALSDTVKQRLAAWDFLLRADISAYSQDSYGNLFVPEADLHQISALMLGTDGSFTESSDYSGSLAITYDGDSDRYLLPMQPDYATYYPNITKIDKQKNGYLLHVEYMASNLLSNLRPQSSGTVIKTMEYRLVKDEDILRVESIKLISIAADGYYQPSVSDE